MKIVLLSLAALIGLTVHAESPEKIYPKTKIIKPVEWYSHQALLWKNVVSNSESSAEDWVNYYIALQYAQTDASVLNGIAGVITQKFPGSFESHLVNGWNSGPQGGVELVKAYNLEPQNPLSYSGLILTHEFHLNKSARKEFSERLFNTPLISSSLLNYSYNVLMSLEKGAVLFTDSENTTLPIFLLQDVMGVRNDVVVLNVEMLLEKNYRDRKLADGNILLSAGDVSSKQELCSLLPEQNAGRVFYYALTLSKENILPIKDQLYVVGLASQLSTKRIDNLSQIKNNLENRFLMDYLTVDFNGESENAAGKVLNSNYLVPMLLLLDHYKATNDSEKASALEHQILTLAKQSGKTTLVENFLDLKKNEQVRFIPYKLESKAIEGTFKPVKDNIYACEFEVTNKQYNDFLQYLQSNSMKELYEASKIQLDQYEEPALSFMKGYHANRQPTKKDKYFLMYPVVNVTYEGALAYCNWLTEQYNHTAERKYKKVKFRLPSLDEWQVAAAGLDKPTSWKLNENSEEVRIYKEEVEFDKRHETKVMSMSDSEIFYPWFRIWWMRNRALNSKGCSLGNFKFPEDHKPCPYNNKNSPDGFLLMAQVQSYFPNDIGLYDVVGNVAEMTSEKGNACGGSWNHSPEESTIRSVLQYNGPTSDVGFRVFMEVIEQ